MGAEREVYRLARFGRYLRSRMASPRSGCGRFVTPGQPMRASRRSAGFSQQDVNTLGVHVVTLPEFARITRRAIASDGFGGYLPTAMYPDRREVIVLEGVPEDVNVESAARRWAFERAKDGEEVHVAFKISCHPVQGRPPARRSGRGTSTYLRHGCRCPRSAPGRVADRPCV